ncbi:hypothetical protein AVEN_91370-1 [Araneus ventricosus]|uniref:Uncharacterized protein n=1 Tax=Araneus ventricosus TaxID=182803 RepID=A0A4Y2LGT5_ARAVE|nr:hypothetical protein AVEN_91370-1 [Araneus ventricosus]
MDAGDSRRIEREQKDSETGHWVRDNISKPVIPDLRGNRTFYFERTFAFNCAETPTSWSFRVTFLRQPDNGDSCVSVIRRTDDRPGLVGVNFFAKIHITFIRHSISEMPAGRADRRVFPRVISEEDAERVPNREPCGDFALFIHGCHGDRKN